MYVNKQRKAKEECLSEKGSQNNNKTIGDRRG